MADLPRELVEQIYRATCCKPTPEQAQNEPCACVAASFVDQVEDWHEAENAELRRSLQIARECADVLRDFPVQIQVMISSARFNADPEDEITAESYGWLIRRQDALKRMSEER